MIFYNFLCICVGKKGVKSIERFSEVLGFSVGLYCVLLSIYYFVEYVSFGLSVSLNLG